MSIRRLRPFVLSAIRVPRSFSLSSLAALSDIFCSSAKSCGARVVRQSCIWLAVLLLASAASAQITVNTLSDSSDGAGSCGTGTCSLRDAITQATAGETIDFSVTGTITLISALPAINENLTIQGPGAGSLTVSGANTYQVFTIDSGSVSISGLTIAHGNTASYGGAILNVGSLTVSNSSFVGNIAPNGGAIANFGTLTVSDSTFSGNRANSSGGGGGIYNVDALTVSNSTFSANNATFGGAIFNSETLTVSNSTFSANNGTYGGAIISAAGLTVSNSILSGDTGGECSNSTTSSSCLTNGTNGNLVDSTGQLVQLLPLGNYGGTTMTMLPLPGSPAICAGLAADVPDVPGTSTPVTTDQRGFPLSASNCSNGGVDAGAVQSNYVPVTDSSSLQTAAQSAQSDIDLTKSGASYIALLDSLTITGQVNLIGPNSVTNGLALYGSATNSIFVVDRGANAFIYGLTLAFGNALGGGGGISSEGTVTLMDSTVENNTASQPTGEPGGAGGGIFNDTGTLTLIDSTVSGNSVADGGDGGGIFSTGTLTLINSTVSGNSATGAGAEGGGIFSSDGTETVTNSTVSGNSATGTGAEGGDIFLQETLTAANSIVGVCSGSGCPTNGSNGNVVGVAAAQLDLGPLAYNGGTTETMLPLPGSAAICAGASSLFVDANGNPLTTDQRGATHSAAYCAAGQVDAGAVQTDYTAVQFTNIPSSPNSGAYTAAPNAAPNPAPIVSVTEDNQSIGNVPVTLTDEGSTNSTVTGLGPVTTVAGTGASFSGLEDSVAEETTLSATLAITPATISPAFTLTTSPTAELDTGGDPGAPTIGTAVAGNAQATVSFTPPTSNGGSTILSYTVTSSGGITAMGEASPITVLNLTNGMAYTFTVTATNSTGTGVASAASNPVTPQGTQTILFNNPGSQTAGQTLALSASVNSNLAVSFTSLSTTVCTVSGTSAKLLMAGQCTIQATQIGDAEYAAATPVSQSFTVTSASNFTITADPGSETIKVGVLAAFVLDLKSVDGFNGEVKLSCSGGPTGSTCADLPMTVKVDGTALAVSGILFPAKTAPGTYTMTFTGTSGTLSHSTTAQFTVPLETPTLAFAPVAKQMYPATPFAVSASSDSAGEITYSVVSGPAQVSGDMVSLTGTGTVTLKASVAATSVYAAATAETSFSVTSAEKTPTLAFKPIPNQIEGAKPFDVSATSDSTGAITYSVVSGPAKISGAQVTLTGTGNVELKASQAAAGDYTETTATTSFSVAK